eukprot:3896275-Rhodomonas_salina.1
MCWSKLVVEDESGRMSRLGLTKRMASCTVRGDHEQREGRATQRGFETRASQSEAEPAWGAALQERTVSPGSYDGVPRSTRSVAVEHVQGRDRDQEE